MIKGCDKTLASSNIIGFVILVICLLFMAACILQWLWNITMPQVFNLKEITFWQAFRLLLIAGILFGGTHINL
jgi:succinate dehydrogenase hydrophobic anchor subunit